ncbi:hypothetical protein ACNQS8_09400 [Corynebacterium diphtheriae]
MFTPELIADNATKVSLVGDPDLVRELRFSFERLGIVVTDVDPDGSISVGVSRWSRAALLQKASRDLGLPVPRYAVASNPDELEVAAAQLGFPCVVKGDDVYFSDVTIGPSLSGFVTCATQRFGQFDLHARALLGLPIDVTLTSPGAMSSVGVDEVPRAGLARALAMPEVNVVVGQTLAVALATADTAEQARESARAAVSELRG